jgi:hypothetical protein
MTLVKWPVVRLAFFAAAILAACVRHQQNVAGPLPQRGYIWQREWTPAVIDSLTEANQQMSGVIILGAEIDFSAKNFNVTQASIDWNALKARSNRCSLALRIAPFAGPFRTDDLRAQTIVNSAKRMLADARRSGVTIEEFQLDFDCAAKNLNSYRTWVRMLRQVVRPVRFVITTLPSWLDQSDFAPLVREADGYVLQVHSIPFSKSGSATLCDPKLAKQWVNKAAGLGLPFSVSLPTYRCTAGFRNDGKLISVAMDSVQPVWPPGTHILEFGANENEIASLVRDWQTSCPGELRELLWYRIPISTDTRNWRWSTLSAVMQGRAPEHKLRILQEGENPVDLSIINDGEADEELSATVTATWNNAALTAGDALSGWKLQSEQDRASFTASAQPGVRLPPGATRKIGWLRFDRTTNLHTKFESK